MLANTIQQMLTLPIGHWTILPYVNNRLVPIVLIRLGQTIYIYVKPTLTKHTNKNKCNNEYDTLKKQQQQNG
jgi:hypothetical protein